MRVYLDEFANIGEIPDFAEQTSTVRSRNMSLVPILQNIAQLQGLYKEKEAWKTILGFELPICLSLKAKSTIQLSIQTGSTLPIKKTMNGGGTIRSIL
ncbi:TraG/TraD family protein [Streptococcus pneumoniae]|nr:TraG/TraD family protein [Streptococcus pneumoniae]